MRTFSGASVATLLFSVSFGAMLLSIVLWMQDVWGWSALATGLAIAPGPIMVPVFTFLVTGRLLASYGPAVVIGAGAAVFAAGIIWWAVAVQLHPNYLEFLPGMLVTGIGVGLTLPSLMSTAAVFAAAALVRDRLGRREHAAAGGVRGRRGDAGGRARQPARGRRLS